MAAKEIANDADKRRAELDAILEASEKKLERRLQKMALLHATTTAQLLRIQEERHRAEIQYCRDESTLYQLDMQNELVVKQAEVDALAKACGEEVKSWATRTAACEAREATLLTERVALTAEIRLLRQHLSEMERKAAVAVAKATAGGQEQVEQLGRLFLTQGGVTW